MIYRLLSALLIVYCSVKGFAQCPYWFAAGPEVFHFKRVREGGTSQQGRIDGFRVGFDRAVCYGLYLGMDYLYARGTIRGETATGRKLVSQITDRIFEFRVGYALQQKNTLRQPYFIPFGGWGHFEEINDFSPPSPIPCVFTDTFHYFSIGFLSGANFTPLLSMGINLKLKFMQNAQSTVSDDPLFDEVTLTIKNEMIVRVEAPVDFCPANSWLSIGFQLSPFYEYRHFGGREGFPFNFKDTKFYLYGAKFALTYQF